MKKTLITNSISISGEELAYKYSYYGGDTTIIAVHGAGGCSNVFDLLAEEIQCNVIALDLPGHGKSKGHLKNDIREFSEAVYEFSKEMKRKYSINKLILMGHSMGSTITLDIATNKKQEDIYSRFIPIAATLDCTYFPHDVLENLNNPDVRNAMIGNELNKCSEFEKEYILSNMSHFFITSPEALKKDFTCSMNYNNKAAASTITKPVLLITGDEDGVVPSAYSLELKPLIKTSSLLVVPGSNHLVPIQLSKVQILTSAINSYI